MGRLKMQRLIQDSPHQFIDTDKIASDQEFYNINTKKDLLEMQLEKQTIKIMAFGVIAEKLGQAELKIEQPQNISELRETLLNTYPQLASLKFTIALNKQVVSEDKAIGPDDEVALLPPFSGG
ncbi:MoaD/ThiS family protein [Litoribacter ruber]|nr:MoaD/ThiS family protein [Litoribacter alkaliphilus]